MATTKKTHTTKKVTPRKKTGVSSASSKVTSTKKTPQSTWRLYSVAVGIFLVAVTSVVVIAFLASNIVVAQTISDRLSRIKNIYASLQLNDEAYTVTYANVFGDKRPYEGEMGKEGRTYSSQITYSHGDSVSNTVAELDKKIKAAGFVFKEEPYPGSTYVQYHYKSAAGEWIRLTVSSKPYSDAFYNAQSMGKEVPQSVYEMDKNAGPSEVVIKVNLDDNNE